MCIARSRENTFVFSRSNIVIRKGVPFLKHLLSLLRDLVEETVKSCGRSRKKITCVIAQNIAPEGKPFLQSFEYLAACTVLRDGFMRSIFCTRSGCKRISAHPF